MYLILESKSNPKWNHMCELKDHDFTGKPKMCDSIVRKKQKKLGSGAPYDLVWSVNVIQPMYGGNI